MQQPAPRSICFIGVVKVDEGQEPVCSKKTKTVSVCDARDHMAADDETWLLEKKFFGFSPIELSDDSACFLRAFFSLSLTLFLACVVYNAIDDYIADGVDAVAADLEKVSIVSGRAAW